MQSTLGKKISVLAAVCVLTATGTTAYYAGRQQEATLERALQRRTDVIATTLGLAVANDIIRRNDANISLTVQNIVNSDEEILSITIRDDENRLLTTHTRAGAKGSEATYVVRRMIYVPGTDVVIGKFDCLFTRHGLRDAKKTMWSESLQVSLALSGIAILVALLVAGRIARPARRLELAARRVAAGDLSVRVEAETHDEVGRLAGEFNTMVEQLGSARTALERRIQELGALYDASKVIQSSTDLDEVLELVLEALTTGFGLPAAAVVLSDEKSGRLRVAATRGLPPEAAGALLDPSAAGADVGAVAEAALPEALRGCGAVRLAPMRTAGRLVGALVAAGGEGEETDRLLSVLAAQLGPAVDVAALEARARAAVSDPFTPLAVRVGEEIEKSLRHGLPLSILHFRLVDAAAKAAREGWASVDGFFETFLHAVGGQVPEAVFIARFGPASAIAVLPAISKGEGRSLLMRLDLPGIDEVESTVVTHPEDGSSAIELLAKV